MSDNSHDEEKGSGGSTPTQTKNIPQTPDNKNMYAVLQELQVELNGFLVLHTEKVLSLQATLPDPRPTQEIENTAVAASENTTQKSVAIHELPASAPFAPSPLALAAYSDHLKEFLQLHVQNIRRLRDSLEENTQQTETPEEIRARSADPKVYESFTEQFNMLVVISTFTASLIISYISLVKAIVDTDHQIAFDVGMFLSFLAMGLHFGNIIVAGRGAALTSQRISEDDYYDFSYFKHYLGICEQLQFFATLIFMVSIVQLTFYMFSSLAFPLTLLLVSLGGAAIVFWAVYWRVSITLRNAKFVIRRVHHLRVKSHSYFSAG